MRTIDYQSQLNKFIEAEGFDNFYARFPDFVTALNDTNKDRIIHILTMAAQPHDLQQRENELAAERNASGDTLRYDMMQPLTAVHLRKEITDLPSTLQAFDEYLKKEFFDSVFDEGLHGSSYSEAELAFTARYKKSLIAAMMYYLDQFSSEEIRKIINSLYDLYDEDFLPLYTALTSKLIKDLPLYNTERLSSFLSKHQNYHYFLYAADRGNGDVKGDRYLKILHEYLNRRSEHKDYLPTTNFFTHDWFMGINAPSILPTLIEFLQHEYGLERYNSRHYPEKERHSEKQYALYQQRLILVKFFCGHIEKENKDTLLRLVAKKLHKRDGLPSLRFESNKDILLDPVARQLISLIDCTNLETVKQSVNKLIGTGRYTEKDFLMDR